MRERTVLDLSELPMHGMGSASLTWWGTLGFMLLEGTGFALGIGIYLYLKSIAPEWPLGAQPPDLAPGTAVTALLLLSVVPNYFIPRWAERQDMRKIRIALVAMTAFGVAPLILRWFEFPALDINWDSNAYGSIVWTLLGLHTTHLITDLGDTVVLAVLMFTKKGYNRRRFGDVQDNALYWNFVVLTWVPIYVCIYWIPRL
jgi:heme/copper-type cytochrome/quinol oxidase subunit 3